MIYMTHPCRDASGHVYTKKFMWSNDSYAASACGFSGKNLQKSTKFQDDSVSYNTDKQSANLIQVLTATSRDYKHISRAKKIISVDRVCLILGFLLCSSD